MSKSVVNLAEKEASRLLALWRIKHPEDINVELIAKLCGAKVRDCTFSGAEARLVRVGTKAIISISDAVREVSRRRFDIAHEIGHLRLHLESNAYKICSADDMAVFGFEKSGLAQKEIEANAFAAELLLPKQMLTSRIVGQKPSLRLIEELAHTFSTSLSATARRYVSCCDERCAVVFSQEGQIKSFAASDDFGFWIPVNQQLSEYSLAFEYFKGNTLPDRAETIDAEAWLEGKFVDDAVIREHSKVLGSYGIVLSLLWIEAAIDEDEDDWDDSETFTPDGRYRRRD